MIELTEHVRHVLRHTLTGSSGTDEVYRNYFAASEGHQDLPTLTKLVTAGLMYVGEHGPDQRFRYYHCTAAGAWAVGLPMQEPSATQTRKRP